MSDELDQVIDKNNPGIRKSVNLLPVLFRTDKNSKFLAGTIDQLIQAPQLKRVDGWVGSKITPTYNPDKDFYLTSNLKFRQDYQLEPALVVTNDILRIIKSTSYDDLIHQISFEGGNVKRLDRLFNPEFYSYDPHIDWDKFVNFEKYYWLPQGPDSVSISNQQREIVSTYNVTDTADGFYFVFTPDGLTPAPQLTLFRGVTYKFNIKSSHKLWIKTTRIDGTEAPFRATENNGIADGTITLTIDNTTPKILYFVSEDNKLNGGEFIIKSIDENSVIDVEKEIIGKRTYTSSSGIVFTNGLKVNFVGAVLPIAYGNKEFIVEGVGSAIKLVEFDTLVAPERFSTIADERFDGYGFDQFGFDQSTNLPLISEYITINKSSQDRNPWSRYNRWFHEDVIKASAIANNIPLLLPTTGKAKRPIIEFVADMQLNNFGSFVKKNVQFIDTITTDVFSTVEGAVGYYIDGEEVGQGDRVIFIADTDSFVNNKTYVVNFVKIGEKFRISLDEDTDVTPQLGDSVVITKGVNIRGDNWWYNGNTWVPAQLKTVLNQAPKFEIFDNDGVAYSDEKYKNIFLGSKIFGYGIGTGTADKELGFPLKYKNIANQAYYLFENYFMTDINFIVDGNNSYSVPVAEGFIRQNISRSNSVYSNIWSEAAQYQIPIIQYNIVESAITELEITAVENAGYQNLTVEVFVNNEKQILLSEYTLFAAGRKSFVVFKNALSASDTVLLKIIGTSVPSSTGAYETSLGYTNNPLNGPISEFTLSELSDHVKTMVDRHPDFSGDFPGASNIRDLDQLPSYGTRLISNKNPLAFAAYFIANDEFNIINATRTVGQHYNQFKLGLIEQISNLQGNYTAPAALDIALYNMNSNKDVSFPYALSDMIAYGTDGVTRVFPVTDSRNKAYSLNSVFSMTKLSERSVLVYHTDINGTTTQLLHGSDYDFDLIDPTILINRSLVKGDSITVSDYPHTRGCYVPPTPSKLGLYPKFQPSIYVDDTFAGEPKLVLQGHDGSIVLAFEDYRDDILLEFERRIYNNIKTNYNPELLDINNIIPGAFRSNRYTLKEVNDILSREFLKWDAFYGFNYSNHGSLIHSSSYQVTANDSLNQLDTFSFGFPFASIVGSNINVFSSTYDSGGVLIDKTKKIIGAQIIPDSRNSSKFAIKFSAPLVEHDSIEIEIYDSYGYNAESPKTWNYKTGKEQVTGLTLPGNWRGIYKYFYDTDRPHTHPWEMLGFSNMPTWWADTYGPAPYTKGNLILWSDIENGIIKDPANVTISEKYIRLGLSKILPVDEYGNLLDPLKSGIVTSLDYTTISDNWKVGDIGPVESAWRRSSHWPYAVQILMALTDPATYSSLLFDTSRITKNIAGQYVYGDNKEFISFDILKFYQETINDTKTLAAGYSVMLIEAGKQRNRKYLTELKNQINYISFKLVHKLGGFINKEKFKVVVDSVSPDSANAGVTLVDEDHNVFLDKSSPILSLGISGAIVQRTERGYSLRGYDTKYPYFKALLPIFTAVDPSTSIGGKSESYIDWTASASNPMSGLDLTSVSTNDGYRYYKQGQVVRYLGKFYRTKVSHTSGSVFNAANFTALPSLPVIGGISVRRPSKYETVAVEIAYGSEYTDIEELYAVLLGYGKWLESQGVMFDEYDKELEEILNWTYSAKEMLFWTTQKWAVGSVITLSPFASMLKFTDSRGVVDDLTNIFYDYSVLKADGTILSRKSISTSREENLFTLKTQNTNDGIFFVRLNLVQKEHTLVLNNSTLFNDVIYDVETGYRQRRIKLLGFITAGWNGDIFSPGFIYDEANISSWEKFTDYATGDVVFYAGNYYSAISKAIGSAEFNFNEWNILGSKPVAELLPNFDYKIDQFQDFYSLDIDNFDQSQQKLAQHLIGYSPRAYLDNIFTNATSQYKFYQGYIKEKGTKNTIDKLAKASIISQGGYIDYYEDWAFRIGEYGAYSTNQILEVKLDELKFQENPQVIKFVESEPIVKDDFISYETITSLAISPDNYNNYPFATSASVDSNTRLPVAGYVRLDDVDATAFNDDSLLDIANNRGLNDGDTVWVGFKPNGDWNVYRYTQISTVLINAEIYVPGSSLLLTTDYYHNLSVGDIISISQFDGQIDGVYTVEAIPELNQFIVSALLTELTTPFDPAVGLVFKFISSRFNSFDDLANLNTIEKIQFGEKVWIDDSNGKWAVYQKTKNFDSFEVDSPNYAFIVSTNQRYGYSIAGNDAGTKFVTSSPNFFYSNNESSAYGKVYAYKKSGTGDSSMLFVASINPNPTSTSVYFDSAINSKFGNVLKFDNDNDYIFIGAPEASYVKHSLVTNQFSTVSVSGTNSDKLKQGMVKFQKLDFTSGEKIHEIVIASPEPQSNALFGTDIHIANISTSSKVVFVSSPGQSNGADANVGAVHYSTFNITGATSITGVASVANAKLPLPTLTPNSRFGASITGNYDGTRIAVSAPDWLTSTGAVFIYTSTDRITYSLSPVVISPLSSELSSIVEIGSGFGKEILMDKTGEYLFISAPKSASRVNRLGKIIVMKLNAQGTFNLHQVLINPYVDNGYDFGATMALSPDGKALSVSSIGSSHRPYVSFDTYSSQKAGAAKYVLDPNSNERDSATTFDSNTSKFYSVVKNSGAVFTFIKENNNFIFGEELFNQLSSEGQLYGQSIYANETGIIVGAPGIANISGQVGSLYVYDAKSPTLSSWRIVREEEQLVDLSKIKTVRTINTNNESVVDYLEIIDPVKGKISGFADQELNYKSVFDPAVYSIGISGVFANTNANWLDEHIGELWWDLSSVKYVWYEQGDLEFRRNSWNTLFPGSMIDVYEWVSSPYLPSQWSTIADTNEGLIQGISGQPKFPDNSVISVKQVWDAVSNSFSNVYYYWVKNKTTVPTSANRRISAYGVATLIANPKEQGVKFASIIANNAVMLTNMQSSIIGTDINLSIDMDTIGNENNKHTEWLLLQDGNASSRPNTMLVKKLVDSLLGKDLAGNTVPDPMLSSRLKYGIGIRPRQSMFKDRIGALRTLVEYSNSVLKNNNIVDLADLTLFNKVDEIPSSLLGQYDVLVEDIIARDFAIETRNLKKAIIECVVTNGRVSSASIVNPGFGYGTQDLKTTTSNVDSTNYIGPTVIVTGSGSGAKLETEVNAIGEIVRINIIEQGSGYIEAPILTVRPFTVIVNTDDTVSGRWSKYEWNYDTNLFLRAYTQSYITSDFWKFIDWIDPTYNDAQDIVATIAAPYQLAILSTIPAGNYVKVRNGGDGRYIILRKIATSATVGTYNNLYDLIYQENGTIQINESVWNYAESVYGWDQVSGWDQTTFDQIPAKETENIVYGLLNDVFVGPLKVFYNKLFFKLVKYALSEQKFLDWAFKTSFINVYNYAGELDQRPVYKLNNETYYQDYINETKPYHTKVRNFTNSYTSTDVTSSVITDFDLPNVYSKTQRKFVPVTFGRPELNQYPWKSWLQNYSYYVDSIEVHTGGTGYELPPTIEIIPAIGDTTGTGAKAVAYIALGKVTKIIVTDAGTGYTATPIVNVIGGGPTTLTKARVSIRMSNDKVRSSTIKMKFDRVSGYNEVTTATAVDSYSATGSSREFKLTWAPNPDKNNITVKINGIRSLSGDYSIVTYREKYRNYTKKFGKLIINLIPAKNSVITIEYQKDHSLYNAVDRIRDYYTPTSGMPGNTATMLMYGLEYPGVTIDTLPFEVSKGWETLPFGTSNWDDFIPEVGLYQARGPRITVSVAAAESVSGATSMYIDIVANTDVVNVKAGATVTIGVTSFLVAASTIDPTDLSQWKIVLASAAVVTVGQSLSFVNPNPLVYTLPYVPATTQTVNTYINGTRIAINFTGTGYINTISLEQIYDSTDIVSFRLSTSDGSAPVIDPDLDTYIDSNAYLDKWQSDARAGWYYDNVNGKMELTKSDDYEDINLDGDGLVTANNSFGPEENLPGRVSDSLGINVYTYPKSGSALMINKKYIREPGVDRFEIGFTPPSNESIEVMLDNNLLSFGTDFTIDYTTNEIVMLADTSLSARGPYFSPVNVGPRRENILNPIASDAGDDTFTGPYPLGFEWNMFGTLYDTVYVGTNGYLTFGGGDSDWTPLQLGILDNPAIYIEYCDLWQGGPLATSEVPGLFMSTGTVGNFVYWRLRFQGTHYNKRSVSPYPAYQYEVTLYSDGTNQYVEMIYENTWRESNFNGDLGFVTGIALGRSNGVLGAGIAVDDSLIQNNSSHVFYSTVNGGSWQYAGQGSFDAFKNQNALPQVLSITTMSVGGKNLLEKFNTTISYATGNQSFDLASNFADIKSKYITVNGVKRTDYIISPIRGTSGRAKITFVTSLNFGDTLQIWLFASEDKGFSEVKEQVISASSGTTIFALTQAPGLIKPLHAQAIIEKDGMRLIPPDTLYYSVTEGIRQFSLEGHYDYPTGVPDMSKLEVYVNGTRREFSETLRLLQHENAIQFNQDAVENGDVIAITVLREHDYYIDGSNLVLTDNVSVSSSSTIKITTFTNHDSSSFRRERFPGNLSRMFKLSRAVLNSNYVWVEVNGRPINRDLEFRLEADKRTIVLDSAFTLSATDKIVIMSVGDQLSEGLIGYRIFHDNLGRTHYKRISQAHSTQLAADLKMSDTFITVEDSTVLTPPNLAYYRPGVLLIDGERIEFFKVEGNKLSGLRRGTLGTGIKALHKESSIVLDQGPVQTIPLFEGKQVDKFSIASTLTSVLTLTNVMFTGTIVDAYDQIDVVYQGRMLRKPLSDTYKTIRTASDISKVVKNTTSKYNITDQNIAYDSGEISSTGISSTVELDFEFSVNTGSNTVILNFDPAVGSEIKVVRSVSQQVGIEYSNLHDRDIEQVKFLLDSPSFLPDKYYYGQNTTTDQYLVLEFGDTLDSETGDPLIGQ
jgi:hypothetical protein